MKATFGLVSALAVQLLAGNVYGDCPGQNLLNRPEIPSMPGPWPVGVKTVTMTDRNITVEIWYPAVVGSNNGRPFRVYNIRDEHLPPYQAVKIPDNEAPLQTCDCYADLPLDTAHGPYPIHVHVHGTAAFRSASMHQMTHYASRGFVVVAADHPGITLYDMLLLSGNTDQAGDAKKMIQDLVDMKRPELKFLQGHIDVTRIAASGHSAGAGAVSNLGDRVQVIQAWAGSGVKTGPLLKSAFVLAGENDNLGYNKAAYGSSPAPKRFVGVARAGHVFCTDLCWIGQDDGGIVEIALRNGIYAAKVLEPLIGTSCEDGAVFNEQAWELTNYATAGVQEEILMCDKRMTSKIGLIPSLFPDTLADYEESGF